MKAKGRILSSIKPNTKQTFSGRSGGLLAVGCWLLAFGFPANHFSPSFPKQKHIVQPYKIDI